MEGRATRHVVYCIVPSELAGELHDILRKHYKRDREVEVVVERRAHDRRAQTRRNAADGPTPPERRTVRASGGRRAAERRAVEMPVEPPRPLPDRLAGHAEQIFFVERVEPSGDHAEERDSIRLVARFQLGEADAFGILYQRYFDRVYAYLRIALADARHAEAATQDTFQAAHDSLAGFAAAPDNPFRSWLYAQAANVAAQILAQRPGVPVLDAARLESRRAFGAADDPRLYALSKMDDRALIAALERLPALERQSVMLRHMLGLTTSELAAALGLPREDAVTLDYRAMGLLWDRLREIRTPLRNG
jgi:RNA polymerase sigma-70 factor (ECF subfamily)